MKRGYGILMHVSMLPNRYGIGSFGAECFSFIDYLSRAGAKYWQVLPLSQTGFGNSPYQSPAAGSLNPYFISLDTLFHEGLLTKEECAVAETPLTLIDYGRLYAERYPLLRKAFSRFNVKSPAFSRFVKKGEFADYALFMAIKSARGGASFDVWERPLKYRDPAALAQFAAEHEEEILFWQFLQYEAARQWKKVVSYAHEKGIKIVGDIPIYTAYDSLEVWRNPELFKLDGELRATMVAGVPPDYFSESGQLWGNPVFDYSRHEADGFSWWTERVQRALENYDYLRIDHFRGLDRYYEIPAGSPDAKNGRWVDVPHDKLFAALFEKVDKRRIIAEDLGILDDGVYALLEETGFPGMCVLSFAFNGDKENKYLPENIEKNSVCYTGTHDNDTLRSLLQHMSAWDKNNFVVGVKNSLRAFGLNRKAVTDADLSRAVVELGFACKADVFILPMQDAANLGGEYRMNEPATDKAQNWSVRIGAEHFTSAVAKRLKTLAERYKR